ncbi:carboxyl transferase domain-containing protein [Nocardiopsis sp. NRRL B-16309]|uniref:carboxyl transferase domain-containing protein n=1 Tax=Nocardiopsis sp. NRRL B-16309 TaxID=1519494 RepID=UPI0006B03B26|nr:carboxyl transferase domain-containing protein [Nocardiopsis sp. NRRL B-16309]KOX10033.1 acetyl-CoA carboxyl transferase [Nocardiopsis sp. NRRL B-16309]
MSATAADVIASLADGGSFDPWDDHAYPLAPEPAYAAALERARAATGLAESVVTGRARIGGRPVALVVSEFAFLAGSIGTATAERIIRAVERATDEGLPVVAAPCSGGTRMQEGTVAFVRMVEVTAALAAHRAAGLPYLVYLRHPTTGGVFASWGSLGHATFAEPGALLGFLGPRVYRALEGRPFPAGVQTAENLARHGLVDGVVPLDAIGGVLARTLAVLATGTRDTTGATRTAHTRGQEPAGTAGPQDAAHTDDRTPTSAATGAARADTAAPPAWEAVLRSRDPERPGALDLLATAADVVRLSRGAIVLATARFGSVPCVVLAQDRRAQRAGHPLGPAALRTARRGVALATGLGLPLVTVVDTPGADLSREAEEGGLAAEIAACIADLAGAPFPVLCVVLGEGCGGGALALLPADRVLAARHAWIAPLPPEGASAIVHRTVDRAAELAAALGLTASDLARAGIVDRIVAERPDAAAEPGAFVRRMGRAVTEELAALARGPVPDRAARLRPTAPVRGAGRPGTPPGC